MSFSGGEGNPPKSYGFNTSISPSTGVKNLIVLFFRKLCCISLRRKEQTNKLHFLALQKRQTRYKCVLKICGISDLEFCNSYISLNS